MNDAQEENVRNLVKSYESYDDMNQFVLFSLMNDSRDYNEIEALFFFSRLCLIGMINCYDAAERVGKIEKGVESSLQLFPRAEMSDERETASGRKNEKMKWKLGFGVTIPFNGERYGGN